MFFTIEGKELFTEDYSELNVDMVAQLTLCTRCLISAFYVVKP